MCLYVGARGTRVGRFGSWLRVRRSTASVAALAIVVAVPVTFAVLHDGFPVSDVDLTARDVWVTNGEELLAGRLNRQIEELNGSVNASSSGFDVLQDGDDVFLYDEGVGSLERVDPSFTTLGQRVDVQPGSEVAYAGDTIAVMSPTTGAVWVINAAGELNFDPAKTDPVATLGKGGHVAVSPTGTVFGTSPAKKKLVTVKDRAEKPVSSDLPALGSHQLAAVGERAVVLDTEKDRLVVGDGTEIAVKKPLKLQRSGAGNDFAVVATGDALLRVPLGDRKSVV